MNTISYRYQGLKDINTTVKYFYNKGQVNPKDYTDKKLGIISILSKNYDEGINYLTKSYKNDPKDSDVLYYLALAYLEKNDLKSSDNFIRKCLQTDPSHSRGR